MKTKIVLIFSCLVLGLFPSINSRANQGTFPFTFKEKKPFKVIPYEFRRYIRPQMRSIVSEFYQVLKMNHEVYSGWLQIKKFLTEAQTFADRYSRNCESSSDDECYELLKGINNNLQIMEKRLLFLQQLSHFSDQPLTANPRFVKYVEALDKISGLTYQTANQVEFSLMTFNSIYLPLMSSPGKLIKRLSDLQLALETLLFLNVPEKVENHYQLVYNRFIKILEFHILPKGRLKNLEKGIESLNFNWNHFHMKLAKGGVETPKKIKKQIQTMHNRWNSVLKVVLN